MTSLSRARFSASPLFHWATLAVAAVAGCWAVRAAVHGQLGIAAAMAAVAGFGIALTAPRERLRPLLRLLLIAAVFVNATGYALQLWVEATPFDEIVHAFTSFAVTAGVAWFLLSRTRLINGRRTAHLVGAATAIGLLLGIVWEVFEWLIGIIGGFEDTVIDLVMDTLGAVAAGLFCAWAASGRRSGND